MWNVHIQVHCISHTYNTCWFYLDNTNTQETILGPLYIKSLNPIWEGLINLKCMTLPRTEIECNSTVENVYQIGNHNILNVQNVHVYIHTK